MENIKVHRLSHNYGNGIFSKNYGIAHAKGDFIAIMDDDDLSLSYRLSSCLEVFLKHPEIDVVGSNIV